MSDAILMLGVGLLALLLGADSLLKGASGLAQRYGISPFVVGMVVLGFGTSLPELTVNVRAAWTGHDDLAIGTIVGSNIANVGLILAVTALVAPIAVTMRLLRREVPFLIAVAVGFVLLCLDGQLSRIDGALLLGAFALNVWMVARAARQESAAVQQEIADSQFTQPDLGRNVFRIVAGLLVLAFGAGKATAAAISLAQAAGVSELTIGLTVLAVGSTLPELASSLLAAIRGQGDVAIGNAIGSILFNLTGILATTALLHPLPVAPRLLHADLPLMLAFIVVLLPLLRWGMALRRGEAAFLLAAWVAAVAWQLFAAHG